MGFAENVKRMHPYQRGSTSITGLGLEPRKIIETRRLVGVVMARLVGISFSYQRAGTQREDTQDILTAGLRASKSPNAMPCHPNEY
jgi:hypothetical protein